MTIDIPTAALALLFVAGTASVALTVYFIARRLVGGDVGVETETLAGSVIFRVSALHGLILALVFAQELVDYNQLQTNVVREATAIADIFHDIRRYGAENEAEVRAALSDYARVVAGDEWRRLADRRVLSGEGWRLREVVYQAVLDLVPDTPRREALRDHMLAKVQLVAEMRQERENNALHTVSPLFWIAALTGIVLVTVPYFIFSPTRLHVALLSVYGGFSGLIMFVIYAFSDPFDAPGALPPTAFERLLASEIGGND